MNAVVIDLRDLTIQNVTTSDDTLTVDLSDGRTSYRAPGLVPAPLAWHSGGT